MLSLRTTLLLEINFFSQSLVWHCVAQLLFKPWIVPFDVEMQFKITFHLIVKFLQFIDLAMENHNDAIPFLVESVDLCHFEFIFAPIGKMKIRREKNDRAARVFYRVRNLEENILNNVY